MGLFDRFKKSDSEKQQTKKKKPISKPDDINEDQLMLQEIATKSKDRYEKESRTGRYP